MNSYRVLPLRDIIVYPHMIVPLFIGRAQSIHAIETAMREDKQILLVTQKAALEDNPKPTDLYKVGVLATVLQLLKLPDGTVKALVEGEKRVEIKSFDTNYEKEGEGLFASVEVLEDVIVGDQKLVPLQRVVLAEFSNYIKENGKIPGEVIQTVSQIEDPSKFSDVVSGYMSLRVKEKQKLLEETSVSKRLQKILEFIEAEASAQQAEQRIRNRIKRQVEKSQREYFLNEQMKAIQKELGDGDEGKSDFERLEERIKKTKLTAQAVERVETELKRLKNMSPLSGEASIVRNYIEWILDLPWKHKTKAAIDLLKAKDILDKEHYGLEKVKQRIIEFLAVQKRVGKVGGQILCLIGPPGVGKTSLAKSIAQAAGRKYVRMSLGGVRDEAEIRGHRRTYIGALPGRILQGMKKAGTSNPLMLLDEIDKLGYDWRGDPSSALLEVLDPEQNSAFNDHYIELDYDLSEVMFITTANTYDMPQPLLDRMEVIRLSGYTEEEKEEIALSYLIPRQIKAHGLSKTEISIPRSIVTKLIRHYTKEAGVRNLERELAALARKALTEIMGGGEKAITITEERLVTYLGQEKYRYGEKEKTDLIGVTAGLAWTELGGDLLTVEAVKTRGKGKIQATGKLGDVMQESVQAAFSYLRSKAEVFGIDEAVFDSVDIHVHVPEGAIPKDGPSAGITIFTSLASLMTGVPVRRDIAMTGEITLRGHVLPIGGLKEKLLAAQRGQIKKVLIPSENEKDLCDIPVTVKQDLEIIPIANADEVLLHALSSRS